MQAAAVLLTADQEYAWLTAVATMAIHRAMIVMLTLDPPRSLARLDPTTPPDYRDIKVSEPWSSNMSARRTED